MNIVLYLFDCFIQPSVSTEKKGEYEHLGLIHKVNVIFEIYPLLLISNI